MNNIYGNSVVHYSKNIIETTHNTGTTTIMQLTNRDKDCDCAKCPYEMNEVEVKHIVKNRRRSIDDQCAMRSLEMKLELDENRVRVES